MKTLILAGGFGTRLGEETTTRPKPMVTIGSKPILWHIIKGYSCYGLNEFVVLCGYKGYYIKEYFSNYFLNSSNITFDFVKNDVDVISSNVEPWRVTCLDTGLETLTGGRIKQAQEFVGSERFMLTYGDGLSNVDIAALLKNHEASKKLITMTVVQPEGRFGAIDIGPDGQVCGFKEKPKGEVGWINGGYFVCEPEIFDYITQGDQTVFEREPLERLAEDGHINCFKHYGFWKCMDTIADHHSLEAMWSSGNPPWKQWD